MKRLNCAACNRTCRLSDQAVILVRMANRCRFSVQITNRCRFSGPLPTVKSGAVLRKIGDRPFISRSRIISRRIAAKFQWKFEMAPRNFFATFPAPKCEFRPKSCKKDWILYMRVNERNSNFSELNVLKKIFFSFAWILFWFGNVESADKISGGGLKKFRKLSAAFFNQNFKFNQNLK